MAPDVLLAGTGSVTVASLLVQMADLGDKGVWYRLVVGPPGSRDEAGADLHTIEGCRVHGLLGHQAVTVTHLAEQELATRT